MTEEKLLTDFFSLTGSEQGELVKKSHGTIRSWKHRYQKTGRVPQAALQSIAKAMGYEVTLKRRK